MDEDGEDHIYSIPVPIAEYEDLIQLVDSAKDDIELEDILLTIQSKYGE